MKKPWFYLLLSGFTAILSSCTHISAPIEDLPQHEAPELLVQVPEQMAFTLPVESDASFHPTLVESKINKVLAPLMYESLYQLNSHFQAEPYLIESQWVSENGLQWVFTLKPEIYFSDGTIMTGSIVASALNEARRSDSYYVSRFSHVQNITSSGNQITITLTEPNYMFPSLLDIPISYGGGDLPLGSGPYQYSEYENKLLLNAAWWNSKTLPHEVNLVPIHQERELISAFDTGKLSVVDGNLPTSSGLGFSGNYQVWEYTSSHLFYLGVRSDWGSNQKTLLSLCSKVIDREKLVDLALAGYGIATDYPIHPWSEMGLMLPPIEYNLEETAERLIKLAKQSYTIELLVNGSSPQKEAIAREIAEQLRQYDVKIEVISLPVEEYLARLESGDFQLFVGEVYLTPDFDLGELLLAGGSYAYGRTGTDWLSYLWSEYRHKGFSILYPNEEGEIEDHFFQYVEEYSSIIPLFFKNGTMLSCWGHMSQASPVQNNLFYNLAYWSFR